MPLLEHNSGPGVDLWPFTGRHALLIAAHFDDEVLFAGGQFHAFGKITIVTVTDSTLPRHMLRKKGFGSPGEYTKVRRNELRGALDIADITADCVELRYPATLAVFHLVSMTRRLGDIIAETAPDIILTHPFEGGHFDHDTVAFAARAATRRLAAAPPLWEFGGYHREGAGTKYGAFISVEGAPEKCVKLCPSQVELKRRMLACFASQLEIVSAFPLTTEFFRLAPSYDFSVPPAPRPLNYELWDWGVSWEVWQALAAAASRELAGWRGWAPARWLALRLRWHLWVHRARVNHPRVVRMLGICWARLRARKALDGPSY